jgi:ribosomal protein S27AE
MSKASFDCSEIEPPQRPHCPKCQMRMITVSHPAPAKHECLRCGHTEQVQYVRP